MSQDVVQEGFVKIFQQLKSFRGESGIYAWMKRIMVNEAISYIRKQKRRPRLVTFDQPGSEPRVEASLPSSEGILGMHQIHQCIRKLPNRCREVFCLYQLEGYSHQEIASSMEISESTSKTQYKRARELLQGYLKADCYAKD